MTPRTVALQAPLSMGFPRQEYWTGFLFPSPRDLHYPGIELESPALQVYSCWWWTGRPGMLRFMGSQRVGHDWVTGRNWREDQAGKLHKLLNNDIKRKIYMCIYSCTCIHVYGHVISVCNVCVCIPIYIHIYIFIHICISNINDTASKENLFR